jgi:galactokinase
MYASHDSLRDLYEVSGVELDTVAEYSKTNPNVAGARMTGAGFGGCAIALVKGDAFDNFS